MILPAIEKINIIIFSLLFLVTCLIIKLSVCEIRERDTNLEVMNDVKATCEAEERDRERDRQRQRQTDRQREEIEIAGMREERKKMRERESEIERSI